MSSEWLPKLDGKDGVGGAPEFLPVIASNMVCVRVWRRRGSIGGSGGADIGLPFDRLAPGGRLIVTMSEVLCNSVGSEISDLLTDRFRSLGMPL